MLKRNKQRKCWRMVLAILIVITIIMPVSPTIVYASDEYDSLREKYKIRITGYDPANPYDPNDQYIKLNLQSLDGSVKKYWSTMNSDYTWDDILESSETNTVDLSSIMSRLKTLARGWATYGSAYYGDAALLSDTIAGLDWYYNNRLNVSEPYDDWWSWEIGIPINLNDTVVLLYDELAPSQITSYMGFVSHYSPDVDTGTISGIPMEGANRVWKCKIVGMRAIIVKDTFELQKSSDGLNDVFKYVEYGADSGFFTDGSYIQHTSFPYAGGYGKELISDISELLWLMYGSTWENNSPDKANVYEWIFDTYAPALFKGEIFSSVRGREASRLPAEASSGFDIISSLIALSEITSNQYADTFKGIIKYELQNGYQDSYLRTCGNWNVMKAKAILSDTGITPITELEGNFQFYNQDRVVQRSQGWAFDVAMHSTRIKNYQSIHNENLKGWYTGDGMTYLYINPFDYAFNFWPTVDPHRLPGITVERDTSRPNSTGGTLSYNPWSGGVSLEGKYGTAGMDFKQHNSQVTPAMDLSVKKSWFMFDDEIVSLGAGITSTTGRTIETVVDNRAINSQGSNTLTVNGTAKPSTLGWSETMDNVNWIQLDGTGGYVFPDGASLNGLRERREGNYYDINQLSYDKANDEFNDTAQRAVWEWMREDSTRHSLTGTTLNITTQQGMLEGTGNTAKNIMLASAPQFDFYSETKLDFTPAVVGQEAGLIFYVNGDNYVYISRTYTALGQKIAAVSENGGTTVKNTFDDTYGATVYFKIEKCGSDYLLYASGDGQTWGTALYAYTNNMAGADGVNSTLKMGLFAQNGDNPSTPETIACFDYFHLKLVRNYLTLWKDHGVNPADDTYSYITLPNKTVQQVSDYSSNPDVTILKNDKTVQAVKENTLGIIGANFWSPGSVSYITAFDPAAVMVKDQNNQLEIAVSDPTHNRSRSTVTVELSKSGLSVVSKDPTVTVLQMSPTIILEVDITGADATKGKTHNITVSYDPLAPTLQPRTMIQLKPAADARVNDSSPDSNYGGSTGLAVQNTGIDGNGNCESYFKFYLDSVPEGTVIESAKLYILGKVSDSGGTESDITVYTVDNDSWIERTINWSNKPEHDTEVGVMNIDDVYEWREIDLTSYVQSQYAGDKVVSISLAQDQAGLYTVLHSKEHSFYPYLELTGAYSSKLISPEADAFIRDGTAYAGENYGSDTLLAVKKSNPGGTRNAYLKFDLSSIGGPVASATLYAYGQISDPGGTSADNMVYSVDDDSWTENGITWNTSPAAIEYLSTVNMTKQWEWKEFDVTSYVQAQYAGDKKASFVIMQDADSTGLYTAFRSKEYSANRPCLEIKTYKEVNVDIPVEADTFVRDGTAYAGENYGSDTLLAVKKSNPGGTRNAYLKFDLSSIGGPVASAKLYAYGEISDSGGTSVINSVYSLDDDSWNESTITWNTRKPAGEYLSSVGMTNQWEWKEFDVTSYVQTQYAGDKKVSFVIQQDGDSTGLYTCYRSKEYSANRPYLRVTYQETEAAVEITSFDDIADISAGAVGSTVYTDSAAVIAALPISVTAVTVNNDTVTVPVTTWVDTDGYNPNVAGSYTFTATPGAIPPGYANTGNHTATVEVVVETVKLISPEADAFIRDGTAYAGENYGSDTLLAVKKSNPGGTRNAYLKFNLSSIGGPVASATLYAYGQISDPGGTSIDNMVYSVDDDSWTENGITWNTSPAAIEYLSTVNMTKQWEWKEFDVTLYVQAQYAGDKKASFVIMQDADSTGLFTAFRSKEYSANRPYLKVTYQETEAAVEITSFDDIADISAGAAGIASYADAAAVKAVLPASVKANGNTVEVPVTMWTDTDGYNPNVAGSYTFTATLGDIPPGYANTGNHTATMEVVVEAVSAPVIQSAVAGDGHVNITWSEVAGSTGYEVYASTVSNSYSVPVTTVTGLVYNCDVTRLTNGTTYYFAVKAVNPGGNSDYSNELSVTPQVAAPGAPVIQSAAAGDGHVNITWSAVPGSTGYEVYASTVSNSYPVPVTTVAGLVYDYDVTGLTNGTTYYFTVKAKNAGGDSPSSNEVIATPRTVPGAPVNVLAAAGDGQAAVSFAAPSDNGGSPVTEYIVTSNPGGIIATGTDTSIIVTGLSNGTTYTFTVRAVNAAGSSMESVASNTVTPYAPSSEDDEDDSEDNSTPPANTPEQEQTMPAGTGIETLVNGNAVTMATAATTVIEGKTVTTISIDDKRVEEILQNQGNNALLTLSVENDADAIVGRLNAQTVRRMEAAGAALEIRTANVIYTLPAAQISIDNVLSQFGGQVELEDITANINVSEPPEDIIKIIEDTADKNNYQIVVKPVEFEITCTSGDKTVNISKFNGYIERMIAIPEGVDPARITTGVVLNPDGTFSHVPTVITMIDGKYYAKISSVTNSAYSVIWNRKSFKDVEMHWAKDAVNDMGSRLIINGVSEEIFEPNRDISRAEFTTIVVKALGLMKPGTGKDVFGDVAKNAWYYDAVSAAYEYGIITGYGNGKFDPDFKVSREQAMVMIARAMEIVKQKVEFSDGEEDKLLENYIDADKSADYAKSSIAACIKAGIVNGRNDNLVAPKDFITRAEAAIIVRRLLQKSGLIN